MPTNFYTLCRECHHVEVQVDKEDLSGTCEFCGSRNIGLRRSFIEPKGFVTAYKDRKGKDPSLHRIRKQFADEARLISMAKEEQFPKIILKVYYISNQYSWINFILSVKK